MSDVYFPILLNLGECECIEKSSSNPRNFVFKLFHFGVWW